MMPSSVTHGEREAASETADENANVDGWMDPADINYTEASISSVFSRELFQPDNNGEIPRGMPYAERVKASAILTIRDTLKQLENGELKVTQIPPIRVCQHRAQWYSFDNRRLWVFKQYGQPVPVIIENPSKEFFQKFDSGELNGETVSILEPKEMAAKMRDTYQTFSSIILKWSIENITNDSMYSDKVEIVPMKFSDLRTYFEAFKWPLLDDTRAHLRQRLEDIGSRPYAPLQSIVEKIQDNNVTQFKTFELTLKGRGSVVQRSEDDGPWAPTCTDLALLTTLVPEGLEDFSRYGELYSLALVLSLNDDEEAMPGDGPLEIKVKAFMHDESPEYRSISDEDPKRDWYLVFLDTLITGSRIWDALAYLSLNDASHEVADEILCPEDDLVSKDKSSEVADEISSPENMQKFMSRCALQADKIGSSLKVAVEDYCNMRELNSSQLEAVTTEIKSLVTGVDRHVTLVQGPPGSGKTKTTTTIVSIAASFKDRVLVSAPTNRAISEVAERLVLQMEDRTSHSSSFFDYMAIAENLNEIRLTRNLQLGDMVLVGNKRKLDTGGILEKIFLSRRIERLRSALSPVCGWNASKVHQEYSESPGKALIVSGQALCDDLPTTLQGQRGDTRLSTKLLSSVERQVIRDCCYLTQKLLEAVANNSLLAGDAIRCFHGDSLKCALPRHRSFQANTFCFARRGLLEKLGRAPVCKLAGVGLEDLCLKNAGVVFCTTSAAGSWSVRRCGSFEYAIIDEAAQVVEAETAIIMQLPGLKRLLLIGDPRQLQALVVSQIARDCGYGRSLFERLQASGYECRMLNEQYRMHPAISYFPNVRFYQGAVLDGANVKSETYRKSYQDIYGPYAFIDVGDGEEEKEETLQSWKNIEEAEVVRHLVLKIRATEENRHPDIGVISPYRGQVEFLQKRLTGCGIACVDTGASNEEEKADVTVRTVDGFQGGEKDVIIFSAVRANARGNIGFVEEPRRLNVAMTRGRYCIWIVGHARTLGMGNELWRALIQDAQKRGCFWYAADDPNIRKLLIRVKTEKEEFNNLLRSDSVLFQNHVWQVQFSKEFKDTITKMKSRQNRQRVLSSVVNLAKGRRPSYATECALADNEKYKKFIHQQRTAEFILIWTVDVQRTNPVKQVIKVWDVVTPSLAVGLVKRLEAGFSMYSEAYLQRCATKKLHATKKKVFIPAVWELDSSFSWFKTLSMPAVLEAQLGQDSCDLREKATVKESVLLMKFYSLTARSACQLIKAVDGSKLEFLLELSEEQAAIVADPYSNFILGRSGTGKTTVITTRLLLKEATLRPPTVGNMHAPSLLGEVEGKADACLRQLVVTVSPKLCTAIKHQVAKASKTSFGNESLGDDHHLKQPDGMFDDDEDSKLMDSIPDSLLNISSEVFPLVITFRKLLAMINGSVICPFITEKTSTEEGTANFNFSQKHQSPSLSSIERDGAFAEGGGHANVRSADGGEESDAFLCRVDSDEDLTDENSTEEEADGLNDMATMMEVTFEHFDCYYWPRFRAELVKTFDSSAVFTEILSSIKGSLEALDFANGRLTEECYVSMACKRASNFDEQQRKSYSIFLRYEKLKAVRNEYDIADYCTHLYRQFECGNFTGEKFHYIYIDEVQDFSMAQIILLKYICMDVQRGFVFAGDTAQTIARGVNFRFEDIRRVFYTTFLGVSQSSATESAAQKSEDHKSGTGMSDFVSDKVTMGHLHQLRHNFRTHVGIVEMANSVVQLMYRFFPNAVDKLDAESSSILGEKPSFLKRLDNSDFLTSLFGNGSPGSCDFGAEQVIIVRNIEAKHRLLEKLGKRALIMTVLECKGLEFQDVLSYNFFTDSDFQNKWRVVYSTLVETYKSMDPDEEAVSFPPFNEQKHHLLMSELKQLYVVLTRARQRLWFYEESSENHQPMLDYWRNSGSIQVKSPDAELLKTMHVKSTPEEWKMRGVEFLENKSYDLAETSFERAGDFHLAKYAKAYGLRSAGERCLSSDRRVAGQHFREAATIFIELTRFDLAAKCYLKFGDHRTAGTIYRDRCNPPQLNDAAICFHKGKLYREAAQMYRSSSLEHCLYECWCGKLTDLGLEVLDEWEIRYSKSSSCIEDGNGGQVESNRTGGGPNSEEAFEALKKDFFGHGNEGQVEANRTGGGPNTEEAFEALKMNYLKKCASYYHDQKDVDTMMKFVRRFPDLADKKTFLRRRAYFDLVMDAEKEDGSYLVAAQMAEEKGDVRYACILLARGHDYDLLLQKILPQIRFHMLWSDGRSGWPLRWTPEGRDLLNLAHIISYNNPDDVPDDLVQELELWLESKEVVSASWEKFKNSTNIRLQIIAGRQEIESSISFYEDVLSGSHSIDEVCDGPACHLFSVWKLWSAALISLIQSNGRAKRGRDNLEDERFLECSNGYLGATKQRQPNSFSVPDSRAAWIQDRKVISISNHGQKCQVKSEHVFQWAEEYWVSQLHEVGLRIMKMLEKLLFPDGERKLRILDSKASAKEWFQWKGQQICNLYLIAQCLAENSTPSQNQREESLNLVSKLRRYGLQICDVSFPAHFSAQDVESLLFFRHEVATNNIYDSIATSLLPNNTAGGRTREDVFEDIGRLHILFPLLSRQWFRKHERSPQKIGHLEKWFYLWDLTNYIYGTIAERDRQPCEQDICYHWLANVEQHCRFLLTIHDDRNTSIDPFVFMHLLERAMVMEFAVHTHLESCLFPESFVVNQMTTHNDVDLYTWILNLRCNQYCRQVDKVVPTLKYVLETLNSSDGQFERWFDAVNVDWRSHLPSLILRLIAVVFTICLNSSPEVSELAIQGLREFFQSGSPLLKGLTREFLVELDCVMFGRYFPTESDWQAAFTKALRAIGNPLIVIRYKEVPRWAHKMQLRNMGICSRKGGKLYFRTDYQTIIDQYARRKMNTLERDQVFPEASTDWHPGRITDTEETENLEERDVGPDCWTPDEMAGDSSDRSARIPIGLVSVGEGQTIPFIIKYRLLKLLVKARERLNAQLTPAEKCERDTVTFFLKLDIMGTEYADLFLSMACPLKVEADSLLQKLENCRQILKDGALEDIADGDEVLDKIADVQEDLQNLVDLLDPRDEQHGTKDMEFLKDMVLIGLALVGRGIEISEPLIEYHDSHQKVTRLQIENEEEVMRSAGQGKKPTFKPGKSKNKKKKTGRR